MMISTQEVEPGEDLKLKLFKIDAVVLPKSLLATYNNTPLFVLAEMSSLSLHM
jgi:hypothetical protein